MTVHERVDEFESLYDFAIWETSVNQHKLKLEIKVHYFCLLKWFIKGWVQVSNMMSLNKKQKQINAKKKTPAANTTWPLNTKVTQFNSD